MSADRVGLFLPTMAPRGERIGDVVAAASTAEQLGFDAVWAVDQLVAGTGVPLVDSTVALAAAAGATRQIRLGYGVMILPLRPVVWAAKQAASLQEVSGGRLLFGVGVGGDRHELAWAAAGVPKRERGARTDAALAVLPTLLAGGTADVDGSPVTLAPGVPLPPIVVGGMGEAALRRAVAHASAWLSLPLPPAQVAPTVERLDDLAAAARRARPAVIGAVSVVIDGDPTRPSRDEAIRRLVDPDGVYGMPARVADDVLVTGPPSAVAERLHEWYDLGAGRVVVTLVGGDWRRQAELLAEAAAHVPALRTGRAAAAP